MRKRLLICRNTNTIDFASTAKSKEECDWFDDGDCGLDGKKCDAQWYAPVHFSKVVRSCDTCEFIANCGLWVSQTDNGKKCKQYKEHV